MYVCGFVRKMVLMLGWGLSILCWPAQLAVACIGRSAAAVLVKEVGQTHGGHQGGGQAEAAKEHILDNNNKWQHIYYDAETIHKYLPNLHVIYKSHPILIWKSLISLS